MSSNLQVIKFLSEATNKRSNLMSNMECPICMDAIDVTKNSVVTDCGHAFHCSCLMQNAAHNGFGCPYCRTTMANEPLLEEYDEDEESTYSQLNQEIGNYALTSFRMFMQRLDGEEPEEEPEDDDEDDDEDDYEEPAPLPNSAYVSAKLMERGVTYEDLVKNILLADYRSTWERYFLDYERRSAEIYGQIRAIISRYSPDQDVPAVAPALAPEPGPALEPAPETAEPKTTNAIRRRLEFMASV